MKKIITEKTVIEGWGFGIEILEAGASFREARKSS